MTKAIMFGKGILLLHEFCRANNVEIPAILRIEQEGRYYSLGTCGFYRHRRQLRHESMPSVLEQLIGTKDQIGPEGNIFIMIDKCANIGTVGRAWSYPGHWTDRTPYGVLQHELGHYVDEMRSTTEFHFSYAFYHYNCLGIKPLTGYCPGKAGDHQWCSEWFAEYFRLFVTNPDLLSKIKPKVYEAFRKEKIIAAKGQLWNEVLIDAPERTISLVQNKIGDKNEI